MWLAAVRATTFVLRLTSAVAGLFVTIGIPATYLLNWMNAGEMPDYESAQHFLVRLGEPVPESASFDVERVIHFVLAIPVVLLMPAMLITVALTISLALDRVEESLRLRKLARARFLTDLI